MMKLLTKDKRHEKFEEAAKENEKALAGFLKSIDSAMKDNIKKLEQELSR